MTIEHRILVGIEDIRAVTFECDACKARSTVPFGSVRDLPGSCSSCNAVWWVSSDFSTHVSASGPAARQFIHSIVTFRALMGEKKTPYRILLEIEDPRE